MKWSFCDLKLFSSLIATSHTPLGGFCDSARGQSKGKLRVVQYFLMSFISLNTACRIYFLFNLNATKIISGILIAKLSEWDALPVMTNVVAKVT